MGTRQDHESRAIADLRSYGRSLVDTVSVGQTEATVGRVLAARHRRHRPRFLVVALGTLGLLAVSNVGLAAVSDTAAPGDFLYPLDRGYEWAGDLFGGWLFGVGDRTLERLAESEVLSLRGDTDDAIDFLQGELAVESSNRELLVAAIEELQAKGNQGQGNPGGSGPAAPAQTAPGQVDDEENGEDPSSPSDTAPGQGNGTGVSPSVDAPGQNKDTTTKSGGAGNGNGNGNAN